MLKDLVILGVSHAVDDRGPSAFQLEVQRAKHPGRVRIRFLEPGEAPVWLSQHGQNLLASSSDGLSLLALRG